jgi:hypothetical protein
LCGSQGLVAWTQRMTQRTIQEGQLRGQLLRFDFRYHIAFKGFRGFLVSPRPIDALLAERAG